MFPHFTNFDEPFHDCKKITQIKNLLRSEKRFRDLLLFTVGTNTALRISDLLRLGVEHFFDVQKGLRRLFWIREEKRGNRQEVVVNVSIRAVLAEYLDAYSDITVDSHYFIFFNTLTGDNIQPIKRGQAQKFITTICQSVGIRGKFGPTSLH